MTAIDDKLTLVAPVIKHRRIDMMPFWLLLPSMLLIGGIILYPLIVGMSYSLGSGTLLKPGTFTGLKNFITISSSSEFWNAVRFSLIFAVVNVACSYALGLGAALLMNRDMPGRAILRIVLLLPWIVPAIVAVVAWRWMITDQYAPLNRLLGLVGVQPIYFLSTEFWAQVSLFALKVWRSFPFVLVSLLASLQAIDKSLYEAAAVDGANRWKMFVHITLPQLRGISVVLCILLTIWTINDFETPYLLTAGGPSGATENFIVLAHRLTFVRDKLGQGAAVSVVAFILLMLLAIALLRVQEKEQ